ncbi:MAG: DUF2269 domain-containing protein [Pseudomonadota bacterium]
MSYQLFKMIHLIGVVVLIGNVTITAFWKVFADRDGDARTIAFAQRMVTITDWVFTASGILLIVIGGYGMMYVAGWNPFEDLWMIWSQILFAVSGVIWIALLIPAQIRQHRAAIAFRNGGPIPDDYKRDARTWIIWGVIATFPLVGALALMVLKPT